MQHKKEIILNGELFQQRFYYVRYEDTNDKNHGKYIGLTVCVINSPDFSETARGVCIRASNDRADKDEHKKEAANRAKRALWSKQSSMPVERVEAFNNLENIKIVSKKKNVTEEDLLQDPASCFSPTNSLGMSLMCHGKSAYFHKDIALSLTEDEEVLIMKKIREKKGEAK